MLADRGTPASLAPVPVQAVLEDRGAPVLLAVLADGGTPARLAFDPQPGILALPS